MVDQQPMRILVAGATGNSGRALTSVLHERGREVVALVRPGRQGRLKSLGNHIKEIVAAEITKPDIAANIWNAEFPGARDDQ